MVPTLKMLGDVAQGDQVRMSQLAYAYGKVQAQQKATMREIIMFINAGVPIMEEMATLAGRSQISCPIVGWVVIDMGGRQHHACAP